jgi:hypothetical protein
VEHALERGQLAVDGRVSGLLRLPVPDVGENPVRGDRLRPPSSEKLLEVGNRGFGPAEGFPTVGAVLVGVRVKSRWTSWRRVIVSKWAPEL